LDKEDNNSNEGEDSSEDDDDNNSNDSGDNAGTIDTEDDDDDENENDENENEPTADAKISMEQAMDTQYGKRGTSHNICPRRPRDYGHLHATLEGIMMLQYNMKKGIKLMPSYPS
jgi:hypothetical protein